MTSEQTLPIRWDLTGEDAIVQGADWWRGRALTYLDPADGLVKTWDTTGYTAEMTIRAEYDSAVIASTDTGIVVTTGLQTTSDGVEYSIGIRLPNSLASGLSDWGNGVWDCWLVDGITRTKVYYGNATLDRAVTR